MDTVWQTSALPQGRPLAGDTTEEAVVIGGGLAGLLTAWALRRRGIRVTVMEAGEPAGGVTCRTTAKVTALHGLRYARMLRVLGRERTRLYAAAMLRAVEDYASAAEHGGIDCGWERRKHCLYTRGDGAALAEERAAAEAVGLPVAAPPPSELPFPVGGMLCLEQQAVLDPLRFLSAAAAGIPIWTHTTAQAVDGHMIFTDRGCVTARHIVIATHFPFVNVPGFYFLRMHQERHRVLALRGLPPLAALYNDADPAGLSLRQAGELLLLGGEGCRTGTAFSGEPLREQAHALFPAAEVAADWWTEDCITHDGLPFIGRFAPSRPDWYIATGFNTWGLTGSMAAARLIADLICGQEPPEAALFSPVRHLTRLGAAEFWRDAGHSALSLTAGALSRPEHRCPHLGCRMHFREEDGVWECPCHGSVYTRDGQRLYGPAVARRKSVPPDGGDA